MEWTKINHYETIISKCTIVILEFETGYEFYYIDPTDAKINIGYIDDPPETMGFEIAKKQCLKKLLEMMDTSKYYEHFHLRKGFGYIKKLSEEK